jgi:AcrR family transcriptional regulator
MRPPKKDNKAEISNEDVFLSSSKNVRLIEKKHQQIVAGACGIFFKKGYHPTTIRMIAKACGMSMGQLYHYISSKDDVLYLVHKHMQKVWYDYLKNSEMEKIADPFQKLTEALRHTLEFMVENKRLLQFIYTESKYLDKKHLRVVLEMDYKNVIGFWRSLLKEINKQKSVKVDSDFLGSLIAYLLVFLPLRGWTLRDKSTSKSVDSLVDFILRGLGVVQ